MKPWERRSFNTLNVIVAVTGLVYLYMKYLLPTDDPFAVVNHPWQGSMLSLHIVVAPFLIMLFGIVFRAHVLKKLASKRSPDRRTGWTSLISFTAMAVSGYFIQIVGSVQLINPLIVFHIVASLVFIVGYSAHLVPSSSTQAMNQAGFCQ